MTPPPSVAPGVGRRSLRLGFRLRSFRVAFAFSRFGGTGRSRLSFPGRSRLRAPEAFAGLGFRAAIMNGDVSVRLGTSADFDAAVSVWRASDAARRGGRAAPPGHEKSARSHLENPDSFLLIAEDVNEVAGISCGAVGLADDGAGARIEGFCHIGMVFVAPGRWGAGIGDMLVEATLDETRSRGYSKAQLWTHEENERAKRLYDKHAFERSGREMKDDFGAWIVHCKREL